MNNLNRLLSLMSLVIMFAIVSIAQPMPATALGGGGGGSCIDEIANCATPSWCERYEEEECQEDECQGKVACVPDFEDECLEYPDCEGGDCRIPTCVDLDD